MGRSRRRRTGREIVVYDHTGTDNQKSFPMSELAMGGGLEGAERTSREMSTWRPSFGSPDQAISQGKALADARGRDTVLNDGYAMGAMQYHKDSIVGAHFRLNATPDWQVLRDIYNPTGASEEDWRNWSETFQVRVERRFNLTAESNSHWLDAAGRMTLTEMVRVETGAFVYTGEVLATAEWIRKAGRPYKTALQLVNPDRLSNPDYRADTARMSRGIELGFYGEHDRYWIQGAHPAAFEDPNVLKWRPVPAAKPWGRRQVIYINEPVMIEQTRGVAAMVSALKQTKMRKQFSEVTLQNAVVNASYAASVESELPNADVIAMMGGGTAEGALENYLKTYMGALAEYMGGANNVKLDGAMIPQFFPGTKLNARPLGTPGGVGTEFEASLLRYLAAALGTSYSALSRDYSKVSYSGLKGELGETQKFLNSRKKGVADKFATYGYELWLEEEIGGDYGLLPPGWTRDDYYRPLAKEAMSLAKWIGTGRGQIDELAETQAAILRINSGLTTREIECAKLGNDFRDVLAQLEREQKLIEKHSLVLSGNAQQTTGDAGTQSTLQGGTTGRPGQNANDTADNAETENAA
ncbi:putative portal protein [Sphingomonas phage Carli]|nr:putative portal protein [Sphingomonas phage Carli]